MRATLLALLGGCAPTVGAPPWRLVSAYDLASVAAATGVPDDQLLWRASPGMDLSCGTPKGADGLGVLEAQAMSGGFSPVLALVLERQKGQDLPATRHDIRVAIGDGAPQVALQPAVQPRALDIRIDGDADQRHLQLVRTQLQMELCLEHKTGRGWIGGGSKTMRQAFLLDPSDMGGDDRLYFGGQRDAVPSLLGPPDACISMDGPAPATPTSAPGAGALSLVPSDIWDATIRPCGEAERKGAPTDVSMLPLTAGNLDKDVHLHSGGTWDELSVTVGGGPAENDVKVSMRWDGQTILQERTLFPLEDGTDKPGAGMVDLLARVPYFYPSFGPPEDPSRYTLLLIPNWQIVEGLRRLDAHAPDQPRKDAGSGVIDGVGWILRHPELLYVQVPAHLEPGDIAFALVHPSPTNDWANLADALESARGGQPWGYEVSGGGGAGPIVVPGADPPSARAISAAHGARDQGLFVPASALLLLTGMLGLRRLRDLWSRTPTERVDYWPGMAATPPKKAADGEAP